MATFGATLAYLVPMVFSLAIRIEQIAPGNSNALGVLVGLGATVSLIASPLSGILSDRTRTRFGRRKPYAIAGMAIGTLSVPLMGLATELPTLGLGWALANLGWGTLSGAIGNFQADHLPPSQRGKVSGLTGMISQIAPIAGILLVGPFTGDPVLLIALPVAIGVPLALLFVLLVEEPDSRSQVFSEPLSLRIVLKSMVYNPLHFPAFTWMWIARFVLFAGVSLTSSYATYFYADRLSQNVEDLSSTVATVSAFSVVASSIAAVFSGFLSDKLGRRTPFVAVASILFAAGSLINAHADTLPLIIIGTAISSSALAVYLAVNQAMVLEFMPHRDTQAGRFSAIIAFSQKIPQAIGPFAAPLILRMGSDSNNNFMLLYLVTGSLVLLSGVIVVLGSRAPYMKTVQSTHADELH